MEFHSFLTKTLARKFFFYKNGNTHRKSSTNIHIAFLSEQIMWQYIPKKQVTANVQAISQNQRSNYMNQ